MATNAVHGIKAYLWDSTGLHRTNAAIHPDFSSGYEL